MAQNLQWYWKKDGRVKGPFAAGLIQKYILLGRVHPNDLMSQDKEYWRKAAQIPALIPEVFKHRGEENYEERLKAARRWAEDRLSVRDDMDKVDFSPPRKNIHIPIKTLGWKSIIFWLCVFCGVLLAAFYFTPEKTTITVDCQAKITAKGNFSGCHFRNRVLARLDLNHIILENSQLPGSDFSDAILSYAQLSYSNMNGADLSRTRLDHANLKGVNLKKTILHNTDFSYANLSYADLRGARVKNINFKQTDLSGTIWFNGSTCAQGSIGRCLVAVKKP